MKRVRDWLSGNSYVEQMTATLREKLSILVARESDVRTELKNDEIQPGKKPREEVHHWLTAVQVKKDEVQRKCKDGLGQASSSNSQDTVCLDRSIEEIDELIRRGKFSNGLVLSDHQGTRLPLLVEKTVVGQMFQHNTEKILGWLQDHKHKIMGLYGMGGVGKTTLLTQIHDLLLQDVNVCGHVYWVTVSQNCSVQKLQESIAKALGVQCLGEDDARKRAAILRKKLAVNGPTILILDDMWEPILGNKVGIPLEEISCKIILSTRKLEVCRKMGCKEESIIKAEVLTENEAWELFEDKLGHYDTISWEAQQLARCVARECGGLPLAIATVARSMSGIVDTYDWQNALNELKSVSGQGDMNDDVYLILQYSYDRLNDKMVQHCFLSCILFPEDQIIKRETLIDLWMNEGLLDEIERREQQVVKGHAILNKLQNWCLLESTLDWNNTKSVKVHDVIRDMAIVITKNQPCFIAKSGLRLTKLPEENNWSKDLMKVSLSHNNIKEIPCDMAPCTPHLTVLMLNNNFSLEEIPESFFKHMTALTVLDLSFTGIERLPENVSDLVNLRALLLEECQCLRYVPSLEKLSKLRVLLFDWGDRVVKAPKGIERLKCLEKVWFGACGVSDFSILIKLMQSSPALSSYRFWFSGSTGGYMIHDNENGNEKGVWITGVEYGEDDSSPSIPISVQFLEIVKCRGLEYITWSSSSTGSPQGSSICPQLETLQHLILYDLHDLRRIIKSGGCSFSHLRYLKMAYCPKIKVVLPLTGDQLCLPNLELIHVDGCEEVEEIFESNDNNEPNPILTFPKLVVITLYNLPKLGRIYKGLLICESLYWFDEEECPKLELLPLSYYLICDPSPSTMESIAKNKEMWEKLQSEDAMTLSNHINQTQQPASLSTADCKILVESDNDDDHKSKWGASLSLSLS